MRNFTKHLCLALALVCVLACFAGVTPKAKAADSDYETYRLKVENLLYPSHYYDNVEMSNTPIQHTFIKIASLYPGAAIDNSNNSALCSKPYKFMQLYDNWVANGKNGSVVIPCCVVDLALGGDPVEIAGFGMTLRSHMDCQPLHIQIQVATDAAATNWVTVYDEDDIQWDVISKRWYFDPIDAYQVRILALDIDDVNIEEEGDYYDPIKGDETRFTFAEVDVYTRKEGASTGSQTATQPATQGSTRPSGGINLGGLGGATQPATQAPTGSVTTEPTGTAPTEPTVDPSAPTETVDPSAPTDATEPEATVEATEPEATTAETEPEVTTAATEPETDTSNTDNGAEEKPNLGLIIGIAAVVVAGVVIFVIIKKKRA